MEQKQTSASILEKVRGLLEAEGVQLDKEKMGEDKELMEKHALPALQANKDIQGSLYAEFYPARAGFIRKLKAKVIGKIANITRNTIERAFMRQQRFNNSSAILFEYLLKENSKLKQELKELKEKSK